jgi:predicted cobalt transporter CbtA
LQRRHRLETALALFSSIPQGVLESHTAVRADGAVGDQSAFEQGDGGGSRDAEEFGEFKGAEFALEGEDGDGFASGDGFEQFAQGVGDGVAGVEVEFEVVGVASQRFEGAARGGAVAGVGTVMTPS